MNNENVMSFGTLCFWQIRFLKDRGFWYYDDFICSMSSDAKNDCLFLQHENSCQKQEWTRGSSETALVTRKICQHNQVMIRLHLGSVVPRKEIVVFITHLHYYSNRH